MLRYFTVLLLAAAPLAAQDVFRFTTRDFSDYSATFSGNGYLLGATAWNGAVPALSELAGVYDHLWAGSYSYQTLIPAWNEVDYFNGCHWLNQAKPAEASLSGYAQTLDMLRGTLSTRYDWKDCNRATHVEVTAFPARNERHLAVVRLAVTPDYRVTAGPVTFSFPVGGPADASYVWEGAKLPGPIPIVRVEPDQDGRGFVAISETRDHKAQIAQAVRIVPDPALPLHETLAGVSLEDLQHPGVNLKFIVSQGKTCAVAKLVATVSSLESKRFAEDARALASSAERLGYAALAKANEKAWGELWTSDIVIQGDVEAQRAVHAAMFYLFSAIRSDTDFSLPAVAAPSRAYLGRVWWDADTFVLPSLLALNPSLARSMVNYRCARLAEAKRNAEARGYRGALFPMESADTGDETAPEWSSEIHVTGDVAMAQWNYFLRTGDVKWLRECGYPVLRDVADFWVSRVTRVEGSDQYEIRDVTGPNEAITHIDNDAYTNAIARRVMEAATEAAHITGASANPEWARIAPRIMLPFDPSNKRHLEHAGDIQGNYAHTVPMLSYPLGMNFPDEVRRNDLDLALRNYGKPGYEVGMLGNFYSVVASELGDGELAYRLFLETQRSYAKPPFYAMSETPSNNRFIFLTAEGAFLQQVIFGFTGLRFSSGGISPRFPPVLPPTWQSLELRGISVNGKLRTIRVQSGRLSIE